MQWYYYTHYVFARKKIKTLGYYANCEPRLFDIASIVYRFLLLFDRLSCLFLFLESASCCSSSQVDPRRKSANRRERNGCARVALVILAAYLLLLLFPIHPNPSPRTRRCPAPRLHRKSPPDLLPPILIPTRSLPQTRCHRDRRHPPTASKCPTRLLRTLPPKTNPAHHANLM